MDSSVIYQRRYRTFFVRVGVVTIFFYWAAVTLSEKKRDDSDINTSHVTMFVRVSTVGCERIHFERVLGRTTERALKKVAAAKRVDIRSLKTGSNDTCRKYPQKNTPKNHANNVRRRGAVPRLSSASYVEGERLRTVDMREEYAKYKVNTTADGRSRTTRQVVRSSHKGGKA